MSSVLKVRLFFTESSLAPGPEPDASLVQVTISEGFCLFYQHDILISITFLEGDLSMPLNFPEP